MSRIHDALKKAEEQRLASLGYPDTSSDSKAVPTFSDSAFESETALAAAQTLASTPAPSEKSFPLTTEDRLMRMCVSATWKPGKDALFLKSQDNNAVGLEAFRTLRAKLFQLRAKRPLKTLLVSSALQGEGKSFVSGNLAQAFGRQRGGRTLLIDADLRKPHMHELLGAPSSPGLCDYLAGKATENQIIQKSSYDELFFIPGGTNSSTAAELIGNGRMKLLLDSLAPLFSWIVIDSSPVIPVSDATRLAELCDGVLLVLQAGATPHVIADRAKREFQNSSLLGVVFNQVARKENMYYKYSDYSYSR